MTSVSGEVASPGGITGIGTVFAINHNADNTLITLRYALKDADIQLAEEPFESGGAKFARGSFIIRGVASGDLDKVTRELGLQARALEAVPSVKMHRPVRLASRFSISGRARRRKDGGGRRSISTRSRTTTSIRRRFGTPPIFARSTT